jgi:hypothetical protein
MKVTSSHYMVVVIAMMSYLAYLYIAGGPGNLTPVRSSVDGKFHSVQDLPHKQDAADMIARVQANLQKVVDHYKQDEFLSDTPARLLVERFNPKAVMENSVTSSDTSYSENKGEKIVLCMRDKTAPPEYPLVEFNTMMFVTLHEMAHLMTEGLDAHKHTREFWANFRRLLEDASKIGVYTPVNYSKNPVPYCGMMITDSPL